MDIRIRRLAGPFLAAGACLVLAGCGGAGDQAAPAGQPPIRLSSAAFAEGAVIPREFTCSGDDRSPPLQWSDPPQGTQSFALVVEDPDAPGGTFRHWGAYDIPAGTRQLASGAAGADSVAFGQSENDFGEAGYNGPCPPEGRGPHRYVFRLFALDVARLPGSPSKVKDVLDAVDGHVLAGDRLTATYARD